MKMMMIGLDGATHDVLSPLIKAGCLPNLQRAFENGVTTSLLSTVPPVTALAWPTLMTGKNPGKHGLLSWQEPLDEQFQRPWVSGHDSRETKLWHVVELFGWRSLVVNMPITYPPEPINGTMISGMLTPGLDAQFTYPHTIKKLLLEKVPEYQIDVDIQHTEWNTTPKDIRHFLNANLNTIRARGKAVRWLLSENPETDLAIIVFTMPDRLQHILWKYIEKLTKSLNVLNNNDGIMQGILECFQAMDKEIGSILSTLEDDTIVVFVSDHGFGPQNTLIHLNHWLEENGWLTFSQARVGTRAIVRQIGRMLKQFLPSHWFARVRKSFSSFRMIDWEQTKAYAGLPTEYGIFINVEGREPAGIVKQDEYEKLRTEIIEALQNWHDPNSGKLIFTAVYRREEIYSGKYVKNAPDIVFELHSGYKIAHLPYRGEILMDVSELGRGFHERAGVFSISGPMVRAGEMASSKHIQDVMPTVLYAMGLPIPNDVDGQVMTDIFKPEWTTDNHPRFRPMKFGETSKEQNSVYSDIEQRMLEERLKKLGYLE